MVAASSSYGLVKRNSVSAPGCWVWSAASRRRVSARDFDGFAGRFGMRRFYLRPTRVPTPMKEVKDMVRQARAARR